MLPGKAVGEDGVAGLEGREAKKRVLRKSVGQAKSTQHSFSPILQITWSVGYTSESPNPQQGCWVFTLIQPSFCA